MPGDGMRYVRDATGVDAVVVNGELAWESGRYTAAKSGRVCELN
jgi:N-acyl-D-aspartate/D-glutamate deacylase